jgi:hypothetical protein
MLNNKYFQYIPYYQIPFVKKNNTSHRLSMPKSILLLRQVNELLTHLWHSRVLICPRLSYFLFIFHVRRKH